jgi:hypothetical protein
MRNVVSLLLLAGAATATATVSGCTGPDSLGDSTTDRQIPPRGADDIYAWLEAGYHNDWHCEDEPQPKASVHSSNRICNNDILYDAREGDGIWPVGAASVKEIFKDGSIATYAVYRKVEAFEGGASWYWYEGNGDKVYANGEDEEGCTECHGTAPRDFVFTVIPRAE